MQEEQGKFRNFGGGESKSIVHGLVGERIERPLQKSLNHSQQVLGPSRGVSLFPTAHVLRPNPNSGKQLQLGEALSLESWKERVFSRLRPRLSRLQIQIQEQNC